MKNTSLSIVYGKRGGVILIYICFLMERLSIGRKANALFDHRSAVSGNSADIFHVFIAQRFQNARSLSAS